MANALDEETGPVKEEGRDINVIHKQIPVKVGTGSLVFEIILWVLFIIPGLIFLVKKIKAGTYLRQLEQKLQHDASQIDNYLEQRVVILQNLAKLVDKAVNLDKETFKDIALARSGKALTDDERNLQGTQVENMNTRLNVAIEAYPQLQAHQEIQDAIQQNSYLQKEITAAREVYNDTVNQWNRTIQIWPTYMIVAAKAGYTTRIPYSVSTEVKQQARGVFF
ncbi:MAG: LemA family protein [Acholeplasmatales bacterium]|nr:LemA family protein [Acholeplasmatales bacterium]